MQVKIEHFLNTLNREEKTIKAYRYALKRFSTLVGEDADLSVDTYKAFLTGIKNYSPSTNRVWRTAVLSFYAFCRAGNEAELRDVSKHYSKKVRTGLVVYDAESIKRVIAYCETLEGDVINLRDRAFVLVLAHTGLRISEACSIKRGDIDWVNCKCVITGKGRKVAVIRFSNRAIQALKDYLQVRDRIDPDSRISLGSQPLFARHDMSASKKIKPVNSGGMWKSIKARMTEAGVDRSLVRIHDFRHYFVTTIYLATGDIKAAQEGARHSSMEMTGRYTHLLGGFDKVYDQVFNKGKEQ